MERLKYILKKLFDQCVFEINEFNESFSVQLVDDDYSHWKTFIKGPVDGPYRGGIFNIDFNFPVNYPFSPPKVIFITKIYHYRLGPTFEIDHDYWHPVHTPINVMY